MALLELALNGLAIGLLYGLAGMGFNLIFHTARVFDISVGGTFLVASYAYYFMWDYAKTPFVVDIICAIAASCVVGAASYLLVFQWIERRAHGSFFAYFVGAFGILTVVTNLLTIGFGSNRSFVGSTLLRPITSSMNLVPRGDIVAVLITVVCYLGLRSLLRLTSLGVRFRAIAENASLTRTLGMSGRMNFVLAFCVASALVAASAIGSLYLQGIATSDGFVFANFAIAAVIVGGVGSYEGALIGGAILGIAESVSTMWINGAWEGAIGFGVLLLMLLVRPSGILRPAR